MNEQEIQRARIVAAAQLESAGIVLSPEEKAGIEIADFGLGEFSRIGLALVVYVNNGRYCAKELVLQPGQICPEHRHPPARSHPANPGKQETFRVRRGCVCLYVPGLEAPAEAETIALAETGAFTVFRRIVLAPGEQYTLEPDTLHWFQAGPEGAVVSEFSSASDDSSDVFTNPRIRRLPGA